MVDGTVVGDCIDAGVTGSPGAGTTGAGGSAAGETGTVLLLAGLAAGGLGRYSGPGWPQPLSMTVSATVAAPSAGKTA
ncbi:hypothetical protein ASF61_03085 [Duganella sp. Leaf126]|nr:hypothetical protein ASF61_03085 [Duganella sp. Leaf126]